MKFALLFVGLAALPGLFAAPPDASPDDPVCTAEDRRFIQRANEVAADALKSGNAPFGAVLVADGKIVAEYGNQVRALHDPTQHAELGLIAKFARELDREVLKKSTLYASTEPCTMCSGAIINAGIPTVVYGVTEAKFLTYFPGPPAEHPLTAREIMTRTASPVAVRGPLLEKEGLVLHDAYWPAEIKSWSAKGK